MDDDNAFLVGGDELFDHPRFKNHYEFMRTKYTPDSSKPVAIFLSCSKHKPYYKSPYRRVFNSMLKKNLNIWDKIKIYTISEPAILVPEELDDTEVTKYDFPPANLQTNGKEIFIERLATILPKYIHAHETIFYILPKHHRSIFEASLNKIIEDKVDAKIDKTLIAAKITYAPPLTYNIPKAKTIIARTLKLKLESE